MKPHLTLALATALLGQQAAALSCIETTPQGMFQQAAQAEDSYAIFVGRLDFDPQAFPPASITLNDEADAPGPFAAELAGRQMGPDGALGAPNRISLVVAPACAGVWCPGLEPASRILTFARQAEDGTFVIDFDACYGWVLVDPTDEAIAAVGACVRGETCDAPN
jgi:hypothetical protein